MTRAAATGGRWPVCGLGQVNHPVMTMMPGNHSSSHTVSKEWRARRRPAAAGLFVA